jgi:tetratricopeptide (TPR) repeat protein
LLAQAREQVQRALALVANGSVDETLTAQIQQLKGELDGLKSEMDQEERDRTLVAALEAARLDQVEVVPPESRFARERAVPRFRDAFRAYGLPVGQGEPVATAERIRKRPEPIREAIVAALDEWLALTAEPGPRIKEAHREWLLAVATAAEPADGWTQRFRAAREIKEKVERRDALEKMAAEPDVEKLPASSLTRLAGSLQDAKAEASALRLLWLAQKQHPENFWVNHGLGQALQQVRPPQGEQAVHFLTAAAALRPRSAGVHNSLGVALDRKGDLDEAITSYRKALALDRTLAMVHSNLGFTLGKKNRLDEAIACFRDAIALDPKFVAAHINLGLALVSTGKTDEGIEHCRQATALDPNSGDAHSALGSALKVKGKVDDAIACFRQASALDAKRASFHLSLGNALWGKKQLDDAIACYRDAVAAEPEFIPPYLHLGLALTFKGKVDDAIACYRQALAVNAKDARVHTALGVALNAREQSDEAIAHFRLALACDPKFAPAHTLLGQTLAGKGKYEEAIACYRQALAINPNDATARTSLARAEQLAALARKQLSPKDRARSSAAQGDWNAAATAYAQLVAKEPLADGEVAFEYAAVLLLSEDQAGYRKLCADLLERSGRPGFRPYHVARACTLAPDSVKDQSLPGKKAEEELRSAGNQFWSLTEQGALAYRAGRFDDAEALLKRSLQADDKPDGVVLNWLWLSLVEHRRGKSAEAQAWLKKAAKWFEEYPRGIEGARGVHLHNWLEAQILRREAEELIMPKK